ncbi:MAG: glycosyltransferase, partial [Phycisphaerae bacterium]
MKILHVITDLETGGVPLHLFRLTKYLWGQGADVKVVSLAPAGPVSEMLAEAGIASLTCQARSPWDWRVVERLAGIIDAYRPDCVHSLLFHANLAARCAGVLAGFDRRRLICEIQTVEIERRWHLPLDRLTQWLCGCVVGNSPSVIEHLATRGRLARHRLRLIQGGVDVDAIQSAQPVARAALGIPDEGPLLVWVGRLDPIKGLDVLVRAFERVQDTAAAQLALVGDGPLRAEVDRWVASSRAGHRIHLLRVRNDVPSILRSA